MVIYLHQLATDHKYECDESGVDKIATLSRPIGCFYFTLIAINICAWMNNYVITIEAGRVEPVDEWNILTVQE